MNILNEYFDKIYCIHLEETVEGEQPWRVERKTECDSLVAEHEMTVEYVTAFDGVDYVATKTMRAGYKALNDTIRLKILADAKEQGYDKILILEDDIQFIADIMTVFEENIQYIPVAIEAVEATEETEAVEAVMGTDVIYGGCINRPHPAIHLGGRIHQVSKALLGHMLGISSTMFDPWSDELEKQENPSDLCLTNIYADFDNYVAVAFMDRIGYQKAGYSDNLNKMIDNSFTSGVQ